MTIQEAIKSGKRFRRQASLYESNRKWIEPQFGRIAVWHGAIDQNDILADDWEIEGDAPQRKTTRTTFYKIFYMQDGFIRESPFGVSRDLLAATYSGGGRMIVCTEAREFDTPIAKDIQ